MRKILIICSNITVALQIRNYYLTKKNSISYKILIQDNFYTNDIIQIFNIIKNKEIIKFNFKKRPIYFNLIKFYNFFKIKNFNKKLHQKFQKSNLFKKIKNEDYEEIWFSNDNLSKIYLYKNETKKIYFSHGANDFLIEKKYLDKLTFVKRSIDDFINNYFLYVFKISNNNSKIISIFNNFLIKNKLNNVLIVSDKETQKNIFKSVRNIPDVKLISDEGANIYDMLKFKNVLFTASSIKNLQKRLIDEKN